MPAETYEIMKRPWDENAPVEKTIVGYVDAKAAKEKLGEGYEMRERLTPRVVKEHQAEVYAFSFTTHGGWANFTLCETTGEVAIQSDWGDWTYAWPQPGRGKGTLKEFLLRADCCYLAGKLTRTEGDRQKFDADKTVEAIKARLKEIGYELDEETSLEIEALDELSNCPTSGEFWSTFVHRSELEDVEKALRDEPYSELSVYVHGNSYLFLRDSLLVFFKRFLKEKLHGSSSVAGGSTSA